MCTITVNDALMIGGPKRCQVVRKRAEVGQVPREMNVRCEVKHEGHKHRIPRTAPQLVRRP